ncbi:MAG: VOC family protein [Chloroflexota bacterium]
MQAQPRFDLKKIDQVAFVVKDLDKSMASYWLNFGIGPWRVYTYGPPLVKDTTYNGQPGDFHWRVALADFNGMVMELIQPLDGENVYSEFLAKHGEGVQHLGVIVPNLEQAVAEAQGAGYRVIQSGHGYGVRGDGGFAYLDTLAELGTIIEMVEIPVERIAPEYLYPPGR